MIDKKHICSFSGGKDSTAMLLRLLKENKPIDEIIFIDTGAEFPCVYDTISKMRDFVAKNYPKITFTIFKYDFFKILLEKMHYWPKFDVRWCTCIMKRDGLREYLVKKYGKNRFYQYIGLAYDEIERANNNHNRASKYIHPLIEWKMTEKDCLEYCYQNGYDFGGIYNHISRLGCWCCPLQSKKDVLNLMNNYPQLWKKLKDIDNSGLIKNKWKTKGCNYWEQRVLNH